MDDEAAAKDDIEDCSESEDDAAPPPPPAAPAPLGVAGHLASYLGARSSEGGRWGGGQAGGDGEAAEEGGDTAAAGLADAPAHPDADVPASQPSGFLELEGRGEALSHADALDDTVPGGLADAPTLGEDLEDALPSTPPPPPARQVSPPDVGAEDQAEAAPAPPVLARPEVAIDGDDSEASSGEEAAEGPALPDEAWAGRPAAERELWERVRPRALRREAARVKELRLPASVVSRLMRLHPDLQTKSAEASEVINYATVLMIQATVKAAVNARRTAGKTLQFEDLRQVCLHNRELQFMLPLSGTLDATALTLSRSDADAEYGHAAGGRAGGSAPVAAGPGQGTLSSSAFARAAGPPLAPPAVEVEAREAPLDAVTVQGSLALKERPAAGTYGELSPEKQPPLKQPQDKQGTKRKQPAAGKKAGSKAPRQGAAAQEGAAPAPKAASKAAPKAGGIASFFRRADAAVACDAVDPA